MQHVRPIIMAKEKSHWTPVPGDAAVPLSQGSHFFQNLIAFGLGYLTVDPSQQSRASEVADYAYWDSLPAQPPVEGMAGGYEYVRHVRLNEPLDVVIDGVSRHGVVMKPGKPFDVYVAQVDAFMALSESQFGSSG